MALVDAYDSLIFDYGGVLVGQQPEKDQKHLADLLGISTKRFLELYWAHRLQYDQAVLTAEAYWNEIAMRSGSELNEHILEALIRTDTESWMQFDEVMWKWIDDLRKAKKRVAILSNMPRELGEALRTRTTRLEHFDFITLSCEVRATKPDPVIYEHCLEGLSAIPQRTLFFDDRIENVQGAERLGIRGLQFLNRDDVLLQVTG
jgi:putative hydrolase of the HAD superfamily